MKALRDLKDTVGPPRPPILYEKAFKLKLFDNQVHHTNGLTLLVLYDFLATALPESFNLQAFLYKIRPNP